MTLINIGIDEAKVYIGEEEVEAVYVGVDLVWQGFSWPETRVRHHFTDDATTSDLEGAALDSGGGYTWRTDPTNAAAVGQVDADSTGRKGYVNKNTTVATTQDSHVNTAPPMPKTAFYGRMTYHVDQAGAGSTNDWRVGCISWLDPLGTAGQGPKSVAHVSMTNTATYLQEFDIAVSGNVVQSVTRTYDAPITDSRDLTVEFVIVESDNAVVVKTPDGHYLKITTTNASAWLMNWFDIEIGRKNTDKFVYCTEAACDWLDPWVDQSVVDRANAILAAEGSGYGPITIPEAGTPPNIKAVGHLMAAPNTVAGADVPFYTVVDGAVTGTGYTCVAGDLIVVGYYNDDSSTLCSLPSGFTAISGGSAAVGGADSLITATKTAVGGETSAGNSVAASASDIAFAVIVDGTSGIGGVNAVTGGANDVVLPGVTLVNDDYSSTVVTFTAKRGNSANYTGAAVTGPQELLYSLDSTGISGVLSVGAIYVNEAAGAAPAGSVTVAGANQSISVSFEIKGTPA